MADNPPPDNSAAGMLLTNAERAFAQGDKRALVETLAFCMEYDIPVPEWAADAFCDAVGAVLTGFRAGSWDDVFGKPHRGRKITAKRRQRELQASVWLRVRELATIRPIDRGLFEEVGRELGISGAVVSRLYYENTPGREFALARADYRKDATRPLTPAEARAVIRECRKVEREALCTPIPPGGGVELDERKIREIFRAAPGNIPPSSSNSQKPRK